MLRLYLFILIRVALEGEGEVELTKCIKQATPWLGLTLQLLFHKVCSKMHGLTL
jgi:hypothetical protein